MLFNTVPPCPQMGEGTTAKEEEWREGLLDNLRLDEIRN